MEIDRFALLENVFLHELVMWQIRINLLLLTTPNQISLYTYALPLSFLQKMNKLMKSEPFSEPRTRVRNQLTFTCSKSRIETVEKDVKRVQN